MTRLTQTQARKRLKALQGARTMQEFALSLGLRHRQQLQQILRGEKPIPKRLLTNLGWTRTRTTTVQCYYWVP